VKSLAICALLVACHGDARFDTLRMKQPVIEDPAKVTVWTLKNGLRVALFRDPRARLASVDLRFDVGAGDDPFGRPGFALLAGEAIVAAGVQPFEDHPALPDVELTTQLSVDLDRTEITTTALDLDGALALARRRLAASCDDFTPAIVEAVRTHALEQLTGVPPSFVQAVWGEGHPYAHELANPELAKIQPAELCAFYRAHYGPGAATLVVTGAIAAELPAKIEAQFGPIVATAIAARPAIPVLTPTSHRTRHVVWGLGKPTAALAFAVPAEGDQDDIAIDFAIRRLDRWATASKVELHTAVVGGRRGRTLVLGVEAARESDLEKAHDKLRDLLNVANEPVEDDAGDSASDDEILEAQAFDDVFTRGGIIGDLVASGRRMELLRRVRQFAMEKSPRTWIRERLTSGSARILDLVPAVVGEGSSIEALATPAVASAWSLAGTFEPPSDAVAATPPDPATATVPAFDRHVDDYTLPNGLRVLLASDAMATTMDVRLVFPVGTHDEPAPGIAMRAATELSVDDGYRAGGYAPAQITWYGDTAVSHTDVDVTETSTRFRDVGFATLGDWHLFAVAWHVIDGHYEIAALDAFRRHYVPKGAVLIVSGGFNPKAAIPIIARWFGPWKTPTAAPPPASAAAPKPITYESGEAQTVDLDLAWGPLASTSKPGSGELLATLVQDRLALVKRTSAAIHVSFDARDSRLVLTAQIDPSEAVVTARAIVGELAQLRAAGASASEIVRARRRAIANVLASEIGVSGRAQRLEVNAVTHRAPNDDSLLDELRAASADEVTEAARVVIDPKTLQVVVRSPKGASSDVVRALGLNPATAERR
jgi:predicted Zn-dependent peptidase